MISAALDIETDVKQQDIKNWYIAVYIALAVYIYYHKLFTTSFPGICKDRFSPGWYSHVTSSLILCPGQGGGGGLLNGQNLLSVRNSNSILSVQK